MKTVIVFLILLALLAGCAGFQGQQTTPTPTMGPSSTEEPELGKYFQGSTGAFVLYDLNKNQYVRYNPERCAEEFIPASTFKIMNSLIGLETGVITDENYVIKWDGTQYPILTWNRNQTMKSAFQNSVVWYYQELARRVGEEKIQYYVNAANYGNKNISGRIDSFWLDGGLRISADEQVGFLKRLYQGALPFSARSTSIVKGIMVLEKAAAYQLSGKTGSAQRVAVHTGWFVGYLETNGDVYFFALNYDNSNPDGMASGETAKNMTRTILQGMGLLPQDN